MADMQSVRDDIAFMRALAEEGRTTPLLGGAIMLTAGLVFGGASLIHFAIAATGAHLTPWIYPTLWIGAGGVFTVALQLIKARYRGRAGAQSPSNRAMRAVWQGVGSAIFALFVAFAIASWKLDNPVVFALLTSAILALYGAAWVLAAHMSDHKWMGWFAFISFAFAALMPLMLNDARIFLVYAAALGLTAALPGAILMRQEPSDIV
jgi:hypothetical protein